MWFISHFSTEDRRMEARPTAPCEAAVGEGSSRPNVFGAEGVITDTRSRSDSRTRRSTRTMSAWFPNKGWLTVAQLVRIDLEHDLSAAMRAAGEHLVGKRSLGKRQDLTNVRLERAIREQRAKLVQCRAPHIHNEVMRMHVCFC